MQIEMLSLAILLFLSLTPSIFVCSSAQAKEKLPPPSIEFTEHLIADMNGDGKPDIISCAERGSVEVRWWRNEGRPEKP